MTSLAKTTAVILFASLAAPAFANGIPFNFSTITFPADDSVSTRGCSDLTTASACEQDAG
ncbi:MULTISPECIES: hypothetical protein [Halocynthiibacter]|uniref:Uncharacterized protein n=1 Tax=Halocynthiibacter halioticoli TaxID=2986804 RepID=A0AAE3J307_9RHOB|nr:MULTISPECIES: hypothetical protein [Halocynthiibacter]MCV6825863.1 hypothetical protein [Halocynthiibacter halioticoli]MCW4058864.1 hypothetical protein [Halocynthiibacter sp. SDUM655004]